MTPEEVHALERNLPRLRILKALQTSNIYTMFFVLFLRDQDFTVVQAAFLASTTSWTTAATQLHTGFLADKIGRRVTIALGAVLTILGLAMYGTTHHFSVWPVIGAAVAGLGWSCQDGADRALATDTCRILQESGAWDEKLKHHELKSIWTSSAGQTLGTVVGALCVTVAGLRSPIWAQVVVYIIGLAMVPFLKEPPRQQPRRLRKAIKGFVGTPRLLTTVGFHASTAAIGVTAIRVLPFYYAQIYVFGNQLPASLFGWVMAGHIALAMVYKSASQRWEDHFKRTGPLALLTAGGLACFAVLGLTTSVVGLVVIAGLFCVTPMCAPRLIAETATLAHAGELATVNSIGRMLQLVEVGAVSLLSVWVIGRYGMPAGIWTAVLACGGWSALTFIAYTLTRRAAASRL